MKNKLKSKKIKEWKINTSEGDSLYILDPNNHKLELHVGSLQTRLNYLKENQKDFKNLEFFT